MTELKVETCTPLWWPRWWRNPRRWLRWKKALHLHSRRMKTDPVYRRAMIQADTELLFGVHDSFSPGAVELEGKLPTLYGQPVGIMIGRRALPLPMKMDEDGVVTVDLDETYKTVQAAWEKGW